jgi:hypothetical protein
MDGKGHSYRGNPIRKGRALTLPSIKELMLSISNILRMNAGAF